jgi:hypothetical protein
MVEKMGTARESNVKGKEGGGRKEAAQSLEKNEFIRVTNKVPHHCRLTAEPIKGEEQELEEGGGRGNSRYFSCCKFVLNCVFQTAGIKFIPHPFSVVIHIAPFEEGRNYLPYGGECCCCADHRLFLSSSSSSIGEDSFSVPSHFGVPIIGGGGFQFQIVVAFVVVLVHLFAFPFLLLTLHRLHQINQMNWTSAARLF